MGITVHLIDGTYELYRQHYGQPGGDRAPYAATVGVLRSTLRLIADGATHLGVATDHVIESFRNDLYAGYKSSEGMEPELLEQIPIVEEALRAMGVVVWAMVREEADAGVDQVRILSPDKDLGQCVRGSRVIQVDRRSGAETTEDDVRARFGVGPEGVPDWLGLVGDASDGFPGLPGWGAKSATAVLSRYSTIAAIPDDPARWAADGVVVRGAAKLAATLGGARAEAMRFREIATLETTCEVGTVASWAWHGPEPRFGAVAEDVGDPSLLERATRLAGRAAAKG